MSTPSSTRRNVLRGAVFVGAGTAVGGGALLTTSFAQADEKKAAAADIASCADWGARDPNGELNQLDNNPNKIVIHHTASENSGGESEEESHEFARTVQGWHMDGNGWVDSGHHFTVSRGGFMMEGRHTSLENLEAGSGMVEGAHAPGANTDGIGIENQGTFSDEAPGDDLWNALVELCAYICTQYGIEATEIYGHRDFYSTECPGETLYGMLDQLKDEVAEAMNA